MEPPSGSYSWIRRPANFGIIRWHSIIPGPTMILWWTHCNLTIVCWSNSLGTRPGLLQCKLTECESSENVISWSIYFFKPREFPEYTIGRFKTISSNYYYWHLLLLCNYCLARSAPCGAIFYTICVLEFFMGLRPKKRLLFWACWIMKSFVSMHFKWIEWNWK